MARLTLAEQRLLRYPPTPSTWECLGTYKVVRNEELAALRCGQINAGSADCCGLCGKAKPRRPHLVWPRYEAACRKAGIEPGTRWPAKETNDAPVTPTRRRKGS